MTMRAAIYARVSTHDKNQDVDVQLDELRRFCTAREWDVVEYIDEGVSGATTSRPALDAMLKAARRREIDAVMVWRLDRLGRSLTHLLHLLQELQDLKVSFISIREAIDMTTATGKLLAHLLGAFAEFERSLIQERVRAGIANARRKGKQIGRRPTDADDRDRIIEAATANPALSIRQLAAHVDIPRATVHRILREHRVAVA